MLDWYHRAFSEWVDFAKLPTRHRPLRQEPELSHYPEAQSPGTLPPLDWVVEIQGMLQSGDLPAGFRSAQPAGRQLRNASVLLPLYYYRQAWNLLFIRRVQRDGDRHSGQVAYPGGGAEAGDADAIATALREAHEEIGLAPEQVEVIGQLPDYHTVSNYLVSPVVGVIPWPTVLRAQPTEVARIFSIPLDWLANVGNVELRDRVLHNGDDARIRQRELKVVYFRRYDEEVLWGASARMTIAFLKALHDGTVALKPPLN